MIIFKLHCPLEKYLFRLNTRWGVLAKPPSGDAQSHGQRGSCLGRQCQSLALPGRDRRIRLESNSLLCIKNGEYNPPVQDFTACFLSAVSYRTV